MLFFKKFNLIFCLSFIFYYGGIKPRRCSIIITGRNEVVAKVMFLHVSVILSTGGVSGQAPPPRTRQTPRRTRPPPQGEPPRDQADPPGMENPPGAGRPPQTRQTPLPGRRLQHTVNERPVRILLECILVIDLFCNVLQKYANIVERMDFTS